MNKYLTSSRTRSGFGSIPAQTSDDSAPLHAGRLSAGAQRIAERLPRSKLWHAGMAVLVVAPLLVAGAFEQLPWQVDSWNRTAPMPGPPGVLPPGSKSSSEAIMALGTPAGEVMLANTPASPVTQTAITTPTASPVAATLTATATAIETAVPATLTGDAGDIEMIVTAPLNVRDAPGLDADVRGVLPSGTQVTVTGGPLERDGHDWYEVSSDSATGWAAGDFLEPA